VQVQQFRRRQPLIKAEVFREEANFLASFGVPDGLAQHFRIAAGRRRQTQQHL
jgi:hypothetical protein